MTTWEITLLAMIALVGLELGLLTFGQKVRVVDHVVDKRFGLKMVMTVESAGWHIFGKLRIQRQFVGWEGEWLNVDTNKRPSPTTERLLQRLWSVLK
ncbi:hypothetical protein [Mesorhizobium sp. SP-1A]|uniref:hypothetical protein n=1 Tax=Mesorhizobium sp. SP-1A TaxID=3077840 RepID=UPI0028F6F00A|nr:hypothetical protein [Mesorhizobium sp. SP-1A]